ncbi:MAG: RidA family protein, partial [Candidatus Thermoplasmatota archaeon]|nr:RidA family protein [Candidatus Thermoplasmatota archaeon]
HGSSLDDVVDVLVFLVDMERDFPGYNEVYAEYFADVLPARTTVSVQALPTSIAIELKVIAKV